MDDCLALMSHKGKGIDIQIFEKRFRATASYDIAEERMIKNLEYFLRLIKERDPNGK